jgi:predicted nuclease of predicted toxin-antitoxin system
VRIKLDENIPGELVRVLADLGHQVDTIPQEGLAGRDDTIVWSATQEAGRFLITQDLDFSDIRRFVPGTHHGLLLIRLRDPGIRALTNRVQSIFLAEKVNEWNGCFVIASERKIRIRRPE